jgi:hypothetical protein
MEPQACFVKFFTSGGSPQILPVAGSSDHFHSDFLKTACAVYLVKNLKRPIFLVMPFPNLVRSVACRSRPPEEAAMLQGRAGEVAGIILTTSVFREAELAGI